MRGDRGGGKGSRKAGVGAVYGGATGYIERRTLMATVLGAGVHEAGENTGHVLHALPEGKETRRKGTEKRNTRGTEYR